MDSKNKMLVDATHPEETRVVVLRGNRVEEFDYESAARKLLRGNIYLAKVTRVEPSLQAAFVEYGGNRHGFLAFSEIHPDYYQIPMADRQALIREEAEADAEAEAEADARAERRGGSARHSTAHGDEQPHDIEHDGHLDDEQAESRDPGTAELPFDDTPEPAAKAAAARHADPHISAPDEEPFDTHGGSAPEASEGHVEEVPEASEAPEVLTSEDVDQVGSEDALEELPERPRRRMRSYKIQEVIKRRQVILVQVVKEERGNKGAALTTYLSLAGRYTVLMPNTGRGGGISRKITNPQDRKRLKAIANELEVPEGMGLIIRTAGAARTKQEIKRDYEYLLRLWESVREMTLQSIAPCLVYEEGNLIKRSIRDLYTKDIEDIYVAGKTAHGEAHEFMRMLMPSQTRNVILYQDPEPLFTRFQIERQLNAMFSPYVTLRSGGYLVINQTEALVAVDVNSGKSTREYSIEETALNTNLEAAEEISRQLKLRDLAGLIVIDFIDMEEKRNNRAVERRLKDCLRHDRARIQVGRISHFGLLEMSRQRLRTGVLEGSTSQCPHCQGTGIIRSTESVALAVLRALEDHLMRDGRTSVTASTTAAVALYILNNKRAFITDMESRFGVSVTVQASDRMQGANFSIEKSSQPVQQQRRQDRNVVSMDWGFDGDAAVEDPETEDEHTHEEPREDNGEGGPRLRRRRRRRGRRDQHEGGDQFQDQAHTGNGEGDDERSYSSPGETEDGEEFVGANGRDGSHDGDHEGGPDGEGETAHTRSHEPGESDEGRGERRGRRRGRRGGRRGRDRGQRGGESHRPPHDEAAEPTTEPATGHTAGPIGRETGHEQPVRTGIGAREPAPEPVERSRPHRETDRPSRSHEPRESRTSAPAAHAAEPVMTREAASEPPAELPDEPARPTRKGWWQRRILGE